MPKRLFTLGFAAVALTVACSSPFDSGRSVPTPQPAAVGLSCSGGDHGLTDRETGWGFCYPGTWRFIEKVQPTDQPAGVDTTFDITDAAPRGSTTSGLYGFMIIGTYERGSAATLADWVAANVDPTLRVQPIAWGDSLAAAYAPSISTRFAMTNHHVVELVLHSSDGNLALDQEMGSRLSSWHFSY